MNTDQILSRFASVKKAGAGWLVRCPAHDDDRASLSVGIGDDGRTVMYCHAGCTTESILTAVGLGLPDLFPASLPKPATQTYDYRNADNVLVYQVVRRPPKEFRQRRPDGHGGWIWNMKTVKRLPYRLPDLLGQSTVWIVEGEKDADRLHAEGLRATTNAGGAGKWGASETKALKAAGVTRVIILPDNDGPGRKHADDVAARCRGVDIGVTVVALPDLPPHGDVSDWLNSGHTVDDLSAFASTPFVLPAAPPPPADIADYDDSVAALGDDDLPALADPTKFAPTGGQGIPYDAGAARAFAERCGDRVRYDKQRKEWAYWDGQHWKLDAFEYVRALGKRHAQRWQREAIHATTYQHRTALVNFTLHLDKRGPVDNMLYESQTESPIFLDEKQYWNPDDFTIGVPNGVVDLRTGQRRDGTKTDRVTLVAATSFDPDAACPRWLQFLSEVCNHDDETILFMQRGLGYTATGSLEEQCFFMCVGEGANGKSIFLDTIEAVFGDYAVRAPMRIFVGDDEDKFGAASFVDRRLVLASETKAGLRWNEQTLKNLTGDATATAERKYVDAFSYRPVAKIWMGVNHLPQVIDRSEAFWRRVRPMEFKQTFTGTNDDRKLRGKLRAESAGIFAWMVRGCLDWQVNGLPMPSSMVAFINEYRTSEDPFTAYVTDRLTFGPGQSALLSSLVADYRQYAATHGIPERAQLTPKAIGTAIRKLKPTPVEQHSEFGARFFGLSIKGAKAEPQNFLDNLNSG